jgi:hypothetical protein
MADLYGHSYAKLEDGTIAKYTVMAPIEDHGCKWDDMTFIGRGDYHSKGPNGKYIL